LLTAEYQHWQVNVEGKLEMENRQFATIIEKKWIRQESSLEVKSRWNFE
jgi:hypothetical protein